MNTEKAAKSTLNKILKNLNKNSFIKNKANINKYCLFLEKLQNLNILDLIYENAIISLKIYSQYSIIKLIKNDSKIDKFSDLYNLIENISDKTEKYFFLITDNEGTRFVDISIETMKLLFSDINNSINIKSGFNKQQIIDAINYNSFIV